MYQRADEEIADRAASTTLIDSLNYRSGPCDWLFRVLGPSESSGGRRCPGQQASDPVVPGPPGPPGPAGAPGSPGAQGPTGLGRAWPVGQASGGGSTSTTFGDTGTQAAFNHRTG